MSKVRTISGTIKHVGVADMAGFYWLIQLDDSDEIVRFPFAVSMINNLRKVAPNSIALGDHIKITWYSDEKAEFEYTEKRLSDLVSKAVDDILADKVYGPLITKQAKRLKEKNDLPERGEMYVIVGQWLNATKAYNPKHIDSIADALILRALYT